MWYDDNDVKSLGGGNSLYYGADYYRGPTDVEPNPEPEEKDPDVKDEGSVTITDVPVSRETAYTRKSDPSVHLDRITYHRYVNGEYRMMFKEYEAFGATVEQLKREMLCPPSRKIVSVSYPKFSGSYPGDVLEGDGSYDEVLLFDDGTEETVVHPAVDGAPFEAPKYNKRCCLALQSLQSTFYTFRSKMRKLR